MADPLLAETGTPILHRCAACVKHCETQTQRPQDGRYVVEVDACLTWAIQF